MEFQLGTYILRPLKEGDYNLGYLDLLAQLTEVGDIDEKNFNQIINEIGNNSVYQVWVLIYPPNQKIIGTGTLLIEQKFIHQLGKVGHIEDFLIDKTKNME